MDAALITLYKNSVILRVFDKLSSSCLAFNKGWALKKKINTRLAIRQRADLFEANISANKISLPQGQSYTKTAPALVANQKTEFSSREQ